MRKSNNQFIMIRMFLTGLVLIITIAYASKLKAQVLDDRIQNAYELRLTGEADSAISILEALVKEDTTNAAAWFELSRTRLQMGLANPRELMTGLETLTANITKSVNIAPDNVVYQFFAGYIYFFNAYVAMMMEKGNANEYLEKACDSYESVLQLEPSYNEASLFLMEAYLFAAELGGDSLKAEKLTSALEKKDRVFGAIAREMLLPEDSNKVLFWQKVLDENNGNTIILEKLGKAYLYQDDDINAVKYLEMVIQKDPAKSALLLDIARAYVMKARTKNGFDKEALGDAKEVLNHYLETATIDPLKAYAFSWLGRIESGLDNKEEAEKCFEHAKEIDPYYSKATGVPSPMLFSKPNEIVHHHSYFSRPF